MKRRLSTVCLLLACAFLVPLSRAAAQGETGRITGTITGAESNLPIQGVRVTLLGTQVTVTTNTQGRYTLAGVAAGLQRIRTSAIGYTPVIIDSIPVRAGQTATADITLKHQTVQLEQIVVTGYGSLAKRDVTGAIGQVSAEAIHSQPTTNTIDAIKGRIAGVDITSSGYKPGDGVRVQIRGQRSLKASNDPLYVLDGVPMAGGINDLNPQDIQSIEVLKDASATAIYGSRGANGVVLLTSRKGVAGNTRVSYDTYAGTSTPAVTIATFNGQQYADYKREAYRTSGDYTKLCGPVAVCDAGDKFTFYQQELDGIKNGTSVDYRNLIQRTGNDLSHQLNVSGGNDRTQFSVSANVNATTGTLLGEDFRRKSMRVNFETQANPRFRVGGSALVLRSITNQGPGDGEYGLALRLSPLAVAFDSSGAPIFKPTPDPLLVNPLNETADYINEYQRTRAFGTLFATLNVASGLDYRISFGPDLNYQRQGQFIGKETVNGPVSGQINNDQTFEYTLDNVLTYKRDLSTNHRIDATLLYSVEQNRAESSDIRTSGLPYESQLYYNLGTGANIELVNSGLSEWALQSYMGRLNYTFRDRYLLTLTTRIDGSSRLAPSKRYATFPSVALAWRVIDDVGGQHFGPLNSLKLRTSYGSTGNTSVDPYQTQGGLARTTYAFGNAAGFGYRPGALPNPDLGWERTNQYDAGADFSLWDGRLSGTLDGYRADTKDLLSSRILPPSSGYASILQNIGATRNTGVELSLSHVTLDGWRGVHWTNDLTFSANKNEIVSLATVDTTCNCDRNNRWFIGQPIDNGRDNRVYYDNRFLGIWQTADAAEAKKYGQVPGQIRVEDVNGDGKINVNDRVILGNNFPKWTGSYNTRVDYRAFDASMQVYTRRGFLVANEFRTNASTLAGRYNGIAVNYWTPTNPSNTDPRPNKNQEFPIYGGTRAYEDGSFAKLRNVTVGFKVPPVFVNRIGAQSLRIYGTATNLATFTSFTGLDPEGRTSAGAPPNKSLLLGANFGF